MGSRVMKSANLVLALLALTTLAVCSEVTVLQDLDAPAGVAKPAESPKKDVQKAKEEMDKEEKVKPGVEKAKKEAQKQKEEGAKAKNDVKELEKAKQDAEKQKKETKMMEKAKPTASGKLVAKKPESIAAKAKKIGKGSSQSNA